MDNLSKPLNWQRTHVNSIMAKKDVQERKGTEYLTITYDDINTELGSNTDLLTDDPERQAIEKYQEVGLDLLLDDGLDQYNLDNKTEIKIQTKEIEIGPEVWDLVGSYAGTLGIARLSNASKFHRERCEFALIKTYLEKEGILVDGSLRGFIRDKQLNMHETMQRVDEIKNFLKERMENKYHNAIQKNIKMIQTNGWFLARLFDENLKYESAKEITQEGIDTLCDQGIQCLLERTKSFQYVSSIGCSFWVGLLLRDNWIIEHLLKGTIAMEQLNNVSREGSWVFSDEKAKKWLDQHWHYIVLIFSNRHAASALRSEWVRSRTVDNKTPTFEQLARFTGVMSIVVNGSSDVLDWFDANPQYIDEFLCLHYFKNSLLKLPWTRQCIDKKILAIKQLPNLIHQRWWAIEDADVQKWLENNPRYFSLPVCPSMCANKALKEVRIRNLIDAGEITFEEMNAFTWEKLNEYLNKV